MFSTFNSFSSWSNCCIPQHPDARAALIQCGFQSCSEGAAASQCSDNSVCRKDSGGKWMNFRAYLDSFCIHLLDFAWKFTLSEQTLCVSKELMSLSKM